MKYVILVPDGLADEPLAELGGKTPLEAAETPYMDFLAAHGFSGLVQTIPDGCLPGSDIGNLALMGYDPAVNFSGRASLEAANLGIKLRQDEVAFRCNLITARNGKMEDYSAGHILTEEAAQLIDHLNHALDWPDARFYTGKSYRHLLVLKALDIPKMMKIKTVPPHDILGQSLDSHLPSGCGNELLLKIMAKAREVLADHPVNQMRLRSGEVEANMIWLWGQGCKPDLPLFKNRFGLTGSVISAVDLVNGIGKLAGLHVVNVPGANGYYDTNYKGKAQYALSSLMENDFVYVHVEAMDEAGHNGDWKAKMGCCERFDKEIVGEVLAHFKDRKDARILVVPDHPTPIAKRTHTSDPVPFVMYGGHIDPNRCKAYSERAALASGVKFTSASEMIQFFLKKE